MSLAELFDLQPAPIHGQFVRRVMPLGPMPESTPITEAQREQRRAARKAQLGRAKAANRVKR